MSDASHPIVLITGSSGFLGQAIARGLMERYRVIGLDVKQPRQPSEGMVTIEIDLTSDESVDASMIQIRESAGNRIASVIHLVAYYDTTGEENPKYDAVTRAGNAEAAPGAQEIRDGAVRLFKHASGACAKSEKGHQDQ
jgi:nucleoside-diphosphate-sugar epimerase